MSHKIFESAKKAINEAIEYDKANDKRSAYVKYQEGLERFLTALKYEKNPKTTEFVKVKISGYMDRAEQLKVAIKEESAGGKSQNVMEKQTEELQSKMEMSIISERPNVHWDDVAGLKGAKRALKECVLLPAKFPQKFTGIRQPWRGILLYGPPGTGKSFLAKALATEAESTFITVDSAAIMSKWQGESPKQVKELFKLAHKRAPSVIFIDEIDSLVGARGDNDGAGISQVKTQFMIETQSLGKQEKGVLLLGATNLPWNLDIAILRRFEKRIYVPLPDKDARKTLFRLKLSTLPNEFTDKQYEAFATECAGYSGSDIDVIIKEAAYQPMRECHDATSFHLDENGFYSPVLTPCPKCSKDASEGDICGFCGAISMSVYDVPSDNLSEPDVSVQHVKQALRKINPATGKEVLKQYEEWTTKFGEHGTV